jgi:hypothetical protein
MKRSLLRVELLEDRSVPTVEGTTVPLSPPPPPESYVIDPPLIDPNLPPAPAPAPAPSLQLLPPITSPIWY